MKGISLRLNTIGDEDDAFIRICGENPPCGLNCLRDVCRVTYVFIQFQPRFLDFSELRLRMKFSAIYQ